MSLSSPDGNGLGRYAESTPIGTKFSDYLNLALTAVSRLFGRPMQFANSTAQNAHTGMQLGDKALRQDTGILMRYDGTAWKEWESGWFTFSSVLSFTVGTGGSSSVKYRYVNGDMEIKFKFKFGSSPTFTAFVFTVPLLELPEPNEEYGQGWLLDSGTATARSIIRANGTLNNSVQILPHTTGASSGAPTATATITATAPWTWANGDVAAGRFMRSPA